MRTKIYSERKRKIYSFFKDIIHHSFLSPFLFKKPKADLLEMDPLTGLYNQFAINRYLKELTPNMSCHYAIVLLNLDNYVEVQSKYGIKAAQKSLIKTASILTKNIRDTDLVGRFGEHEFILILYNIDLEHANQVAKRCLDLIQNDIVHFNVKSIPLQASGGVSVSAQDLVSDKVLQQADQALFLAKSSGYNQLRDQTAIFT
ncbi:GGDEF domain-containing protein [Acinetobacter shaoyimingii]|uniref:diguanylate cyclase n=1 Tax=Acinetobacter shaoyimingii TaxID=2715164 RepID=A0A6G8RS34_9GAMM|nr:GGDEF domain-containing protein [Acinetobacter shaoyimingii]QIO04598.1 GGDEF domain-containing protein [Acinetobacter shaoyimingii]